MTMEQLEALPKQGMDLELDTHHRLLVGDPVAMRSELLENRAVLGWIIAGALQHFSLSQRRVSSLPIFLTQSVRNRERYNLPFRVQLREYAPPRAAAFSRWCEYCAGGV